MPYFKGFEASSVWVRFPSPAPLPSYFPAIDLAVDQIWIKPLARALHTRGQAPKYDLDARRERLVYRVLDLNKDDLGGRRHAPAKQGVRNFRAPQQMSDVVHVRSYDCRGRLRYRNRNHIAIDNCGSLRGGKQCSYLPGAFLVQFREAVNRAEQRCGSWMGRRSAPGFSDHGCWHQNRCPGFSGRLQ
jgi:hypothetical protein